MALVLGTSALVLGTWHLDLWRVVLGTWHLDLWWLCSEPGTWIFGGCARNLVLGSLAVVHGTLALRSLAVILLGGLFKLSLGNIFRRS